MTVFAMPSRGGHLPKIDVEIGVLANSRPAA